MSDYSYSELMKMQNDAIRRVEDMQRRARQSAGLDNDGKTDRPTEKENVGQKVSGDSEKDAEYNVKKEQPRRVPMPDDYLKKLKNYATSSHGGNADIHDKEDMPKENNGKKLTRESGGEENGNGKNLSEKIKNYTGDINTDSDKALLLSLIILLSEEKADELLILALIYMMT